VALGFIKSLVDYIRPSEINTIEQKSELLSTSEEVTQEKEDPTSTLEADTVEEVVEEKVEKVDDIVFDGGGSIFGTPTPPEPEQESQEELKPDEIIEEVPEAPEPGRVTFIENSPTSINYVKAKSSHQSVYIDPTKII
jgi:hypothetical protein